jgi:ribosomal protein S27E
LENQEKQQNTLLADRYRHEFVEVACPICDQRKIICVPDEPVPNCEFCRVPMIIKEVLTEGKY